VYLKDKKVKGSFFGFLDFEVVSGMAQIFLFCYGKVDFKFSSSCIGMDAGEKL
jgi:hypothetical protein